MRSTKPLYLTPSVGAFYTQVDYDDATDSAGKIAKYNTLRQLELEAGVKLTKAFVMDEGYANVYVKPSVVRTVTDGDEVKITGLGKVNTLDDQTLGRVELGGRYGFHRTVVGLWLGQPHLRRRLQSLDYIVGDGGG